MDTEQQNNQSENPTQSELDFGTNERITPKKITQPALSVLEKIRSLFDKKDFVVNKFATRKESALTEHDTTQQTEQNANIEKSESFAQTDTAQAQIDNPSSTSTPSPQKNSFKNPENWKILGVLPQKHRRLFIALLVLVLLLIFFFMMKPSSDTVQSFEQQSANDVPIQFQSIDQSQFTENDSLDAMNSEQNIMARDQVGNTVPSTDALQTPETTQPEQMSTTTPQPQLEDAQKLTEQRLAQEKAEKARLEEKAKADALAKANAEKAKAERAKAEQAAQMMANNGRVPVIDAKPTRSATSSNTAVTSKTLIVPKGVGLMQVFRNNKLNIADVNAMTKANGAGNTLNNLKPNDKIQVLINAQGRVTELRLPNGGRFIRQTDGSYKFQK